MSIQATAELFKNPVFIYKADVDQIILDMATSIHARNKTVPLEQYIARCKAIVIEYAVAAATNGSRNPNEFDHRDHETYFYDVVSDHGLFECKQISDPYYSFNDEQINTFMKHRMKLNYMVIADYVEYDRGYLVEFKYLADAPSFRKYTGTSVYHKYKSKYYDHKEAIRDGMCIKLYRDEVLDYNQSLLKGNI